MDFIKDYKWWLIGGVVALMVSIVATLLVLNLVTSDNEIDYENRDKRIVSNILINAVDGGSIEQSENYYNGLVESGFLSQSVKDEYFDFNSMAVNTMWGRYDTGANKEISIRMNEKIGENDEGVKNYLTVVSYRYPINKEDLGHDYAGEWLDGNLYYRVNKVIVSVVNKQGQVMDLTSFPESSIVNSSEDSGLDVEDKHLFDEGLVPIEESYIEDMINGNIHKHEDNIEGSD